jgi:hypothetical protein
MSEDSLQVTYNDDGTFTIDWDPCDSRYSVWNDMTEEELSAMLMEQIKLKLEELGDDC